MHYLIPLSYNPIDIEALTRVLTGYSNKHHTLLIQDFEKAIGAITGSHVVALNSGTSAIHLAMKVLGVGNNDIILAPTFTYIATVNPALYVGAKLVFIDALPDTWNMNPALLEKAIQDLEKQSLKPKAIVIVHTYGMPSDMIEIGRIAKKYDIPVLEDAAESFGSTYHKQQTGTLGKVGVYSFNNNKTFTTYGGGVLLTTDSSLAKQARFLASQARESLPYYQHNESGFNYLMSALNAAYGLSQLAEFNKNVEKRRMNVAGYQSALSGLNIEFQQERPEMHSNHWFSTVLFENQEIRLQVAKALSDSGIETRPLWKPMHLQPVFSGMKSYVTGVSQNLFERGLCLPSGNNLKSDEQAKIVNVIKQVTSSYPARI